MKVKNSEKKSVAMMSVLASTFLVLFKLVIGVATGSLGILSEALDSGIDMIASIVTFFAVKISDKPANQKFNYGHGKVENLSALFETLLLFFIVGWILFHAINNLITGTHEVDATIWSYIVIITSIVVDISRTTKMKKVAKKTNSQALEADAANFTADMIGCVFVLVSLIFTNLGYPIADSIAALIVSVIILRIAIKMLLKSINALLDKVPDGYTSKIKGYLLNEGIHFHSLKVRASGPDIFIKFHIHLDPKTTVLISHNICDDLERGIKKLIPRSETSIHVEPNSESHVNNEINDGL